MRCYSNRPLEGPVSLAAAVVERARLDADGSVVRNGGDIALCGDHEPVPCAEAFLERVMRYATEHRSDAEGIALFVLAGVLE